MLGRYTVRVMIFCWFFASPVADSISGSRTESFNLICFHSFIPSAMISFSSRVSNHAT
ncbi:unnamed protein product [Haemonchus placei]|uniref:Secreted protein n=1 Tax=Haemonchus placei TaxID=6290 RepID=A0A0N4WFR7_HAEPC|nr:unnamed protein product [Haemonchus placei]